jgi:hypothetical protein
MKILSAALEGEALNYAVALAMHDEPSYTKQGFTFTTSHYPRAFQPAMFWEHGGPIIESEGIDLVKIGAKQWRADCGPACTGSTPLIAAMRTFVTKELGMAVEIPDAILN